MKPKLPNPPKADLRKEFSVIFKYILKSDYSQQRAMISRKRAERLSWSFLVNQKSSNTYDRCSNN